ncbi:MAG: glutaredoxin [Erysipelotrichales bacterium]|nr:glutaredoxin [Erysipelotrichales bacterium]
MKLFILENCPHCIRAMNWIKELYEEYPKYRDIPIELIDEAKDNELADSYDYYYVPCFFEGNVKLHEGVASKEIIRNIFDDYLRRNK